MKQGLTIQEMSKEILRQSQAKTDYLVNTANLRMEAYGGEPMSRVLDATHCVGPLAIYRSFSIFSRSASRASSNPSRSSRRRRPVSPRISAT